MSSSRFFLQKLSFELYIACQLSHFTHQKIPSNSLPATQAGKIVGVFKIAFTLVMTVSFISTLV
jgi:hypothetical protein